jgi:Fe-S cluster assembly protein SufD
LEDEEQVHNYVRVNHNGLSCTSNQNFKNILNGKSLASVDTTVVVNKGARLTKSDQLINNLMLSKYSRADTKPNLMIFTDDVKCTHGATVGQIDDNQLLYLKTRGLSDEDARSLLTSGFAKGIIEYMFHRPVVDEVYDTLFKKLEGAYGR